MNTNQTVKLYRTASDYVIVKNRTVIRRVHVKSTALRIARQVFRATLKLATGPVLFSDKTRTVSKI